MRSKPLMNPYGSGFEKGHAVRHFDPPHRTCKPARSFDDSLAQPGLHPKQRRERGTAGELGHLLVKLDDSISDFLAHVDNDTLQLPRRPRILVAHYGLR